MTVALNTPTTYTQALAKGGALLDETRVLLKAWRPGETEQELSARVLAEDLLGRATALRVRDIVHVFTLRFMRPDDQPARDLQRLVGGGAPRHLYRDLVFYYSAQRDDLLHDFTVERYWPAVRSGRLTIDNSDVRQLILDAERDGRIRAAWSAEIKRDMAGRVMVTLTDFGLLRELKPARREVMPYAPAEETLVYIAHLLHDHGVPDSSLASAGAWALFGLEPRDVSHRLKDLSAAGWFIVQQGDITRITWKYRIQEVVDVLAG